MIRNYLYIAPVFFFGFFCLSLQTAYAQRPNNEATTAAYMERLVGKGAITELTNFCKLLPKGGDLHHHYSGSIYAEDIIEQAIELDLYVDTLTFVVSKNPSHGIPLKRLYGDVPRFEKLISLWSVEGYDKYNNPSIPRYEHFFNTFTLFPSESVDAYLSQMLRLKKRAIDENVQYIETMIASPKPIVTPKANTKRYDSILFSCIATQNQQLTQSTLAEMYNLIMQKDNKPSIDQRLNEERTFFKALSLAMDDTSFIARFQLYLFRNSNLYFNSFLSVLSSFVIADALPSYVAGVNIVGPEHHQSALRNYWIHMQMFSFLKNKFPNVKTAMHAGELRSGLVPPEKMSDHIEQAIFTAKADRIGHGVDIGHEKNAIQILSYMRNQNKAIEINLTSNDFILGVKGEQHPLSFYMAQRVPVVICTDDAGVLRSSLTEEFVRLSTEHKVDYMTIKSMIFNSIKYSFLDEASKAKQTDILRNKFNTFEQQIAQISQ